VGFNDEVSTLYSQTESQHSKFSTVELKNHTVNTTSCHVSRWWRQS